MYFTKHNTLYLLFKWICIADSEYVPAFLISYQFEMRIWWLPDVSRYMDSRKTPEVSSPCKHVDIVNVILLKLLYLDSRRTCPLHELSAYKIN